MGRKGVLGGMTMEQLIKILLGAMLAAGVLFMLIPTIFGGVEATCSIISEVIAGMPGASDLLEFLGMLEC